MSQPVAAVTVTLSVVTALKFRDPEITQQLKEKSTSRETLSLQYLKPDGTTILLIPLYHLSIHFSQKSAISRVQGMLIYTPSHCWAPQGPILGQD